LERYIEYKRLIREARGTFGWFRLKRKYLASMYLASLSDLRPAEEAFKRLKRLVEEKPFFKRFFSLLHDYLENEDWPYDPLAYGAVDFFASLTDPKYCTLVRYLAGRRIEDIRVAKVEDEEVEPVIVLGQEISPCAITAKGRYCWITKIAAPVDYEKLQRVYSTEGLREYQVRPFLETVAYLERRRGAILQAPTGFGKTVVGSKIIDAMLASGKASKAFVVVPLRTLKKQWEESLRKVCPDCDVSVSTYQSLYSKLKRRSVPRMFTTLLLSATEELEKGGADGDYDTEDLLSEYLRSDLIIFDEVHTARAMSLGLVLDANKRAVRLGLSATPEWVGSNLRFEALKVLFGPIVKGPETRELIEIGALSDVEFVQVIAPIHEIEECVSEEKKPVAHCVGRYVDRVAEVVERVYEKYAKGKTAVLVPLRALCKEVAERIGAECFTSENSSGLHSVREIKDLTYVATTPLVQQGWDDPLLETVIVADVISNPYRLRQLIGRVLRTHEEKEKARVVDICIFNEKACEKRREVYKKIADTVHVERLEEPVQVSSTIVEPDEEKEEEKENFQEEVQEEADDKIEEESESTEEQEMTEGMGEEFTNGEEESGEEKSEITVGLSY